MRTGNWRQLRERIIPTGTREAQASPGSRWHSRGLAAIGIIILLLWALSLSLPTLGGLNFTPDAAEYTGIARRLAEGHGLTTAIKWHFFDNGPVVRSAISERPILYPLFASFVLRLSPETEPLYLLQVANALLAAVNAVLALGAYRTCVSPPAAWLAAFLLPLTPPMTQTATTALSEQLFLFFWLAALLLLIRLKKRSGAGACGLLVGFAMLTRPNGVLLGLAALPLLCAWRDRKRALTGAGWVAAGAILVLLPCLALMVAAKAPGIRSGALVNFSVMHIHDASWHGFGREIPFPLTFIEAHCGAVLWAVYRKMLANFQALWLSLGPLALLALLPLTRRADPPRDSAASLPRIWILLAGANFLFYTTSWVASGAVRYLLPTTATLLPILVHWGITGARRSKIAKVALALVIAGTLLIQGGLWRAHRQACARQWDAVRWEPYRVAAGWIQALAAPEDVVGSNNPWMVNYLTRRPALTCPYFRPGAGIDALARRFNVRWVLLWAGPGDSRLQNCLRQPSVCLVRSRVDARGRGIYLFAVQKDKVLNAYQRE